MSGLVAISLSYSSILSAGIVFFLGVAIVPSSNPRGVSAYPRVYNRQAVRRSTLGIAMIFVSRRLLPTVVGMIGALLLCVNLAAQESCPAEVKLLLRAEQTQAA